MQNKPNLLDAQMNAGSALAKDYEKQGRLRTPGKQTQSNPISKGAPMMLCGALLRTGTFEIATAFGLAMTNPAIVMAGLTEANRAGGLWVYIRVWIHNAREGS